ncbi:hypothetical protein PPYR_14379 [Photinus pyralis]|uniref:RING-type E3 ubiquitin transferase n=1 Tax=Photinus pyralis TaxID=7054 RepID=A0A1Y1LA88_PHOPY|nr:hypothetical protein PPYR_14379 [Photinus pyralis]
MGHEQVTSKFQRQFAPYPIHRQLYMRQQYEQERRRQSLVISSRVSGTPPCDTYRTLVCNQNAEISRDKFIQKITRFIDQHSVKVMSLCSDCTDKCIICMCNYSENEGLRKLRCNHKFHRKCIDEWLLKSYMCPVCRSDLIGSAKGCNDACILHGESNWERVPNNYDESTSTSSVTLQ